MSLHHLLTTLPPAQHAILISENYKNALGPFMIEACGGSKEDITLFEKKREEESEIVRRMSVNGTVRAISNTREQGRRWRGTLCGNRIERKDVERIWHF